MLLGIVVGHHDGAAVDGHAGMEQAFPVFVGMAKEVGRPKCLLVEIERLFGAVDRQIWRDRLHGSPLLCVCAFPRNLNALKSGATRPLTGNVMAKPRTLYDKIWNDHMVDEQP